jgi:uncharacterized protein YjeT (DUF2065 family)
MLDRPLSDDRYPVAGRGRLSRFQENRASNLPPARFRRDGGLFVGLLVGVILIVGGLTYFPVPRAWTHGRTGRDASLGTLY